MYLSQTDRVVGWLLTSFAIASSFIVALIFWFLAAGAWPALEAVGLARFFTDEYWYPSSNLFDLTPMVVGTGLVTLGSVAAATPLGILCAFFLVYVAPRPLGFIFRGITQLLAGIPSVVYGFWGLVVLVPLIARWNPPGTSLLAGVIVLTIMILPTIALTSVAALEQASRSGLIGGQALGLGLWDSIHIGVLPKALPAMATGVLLAVGRAIGETMAILMVCGNIVQVPHSFFEPVRTLTSNIALEMSYAMGTHQSALVVSGLILLVLITLLVLGAETILRRRPAGVSSH